MTERGFNVGDRILSKSTDTHSDWCAAFAQLGDYCFVGASAVGKLHLHKTIPRDDAFAARSAGKWLAVAISDGVGSRPRSRYGASFAVEALCGYLLNEVVSHAQKADNPDPASSSEFIMQDRVNTENNIGTEAPKKADSENAEELLSEDEEVTRSQSVFKALIPVDASPDILSNCSYGTLSWSRSLVHSLIMDVKETEQITSEPAKESISGINLESVMQQAFASVHAGLKSYALSQECNIKEFPCTLLGLLINTHTGEAVVGHVGDGLVLALNSDEAQILIDPITPEETGSVYVITQVDWETYLTIRKVSSRYDMYYLMTDGVADDYLYGKADILNQWAKDINREIYKYPSLSDAAQSLLRFLANYDVRGSYDDRTLVLIFPIPKDEQNDKCSVE